MEYDYDVIVIGGGTAGLGAYRRAKSLGKKALIVEANDFVTTCANVGCMPSKLLIAAAENMESIEKAKEFGIDIKEVQINNKVLWNRIRSERDRFVGFVKKGASTIDREDKIIGYAKFISPNTIVVNEKTITSKSFVIATGSRPIYPEIFTSIKDDVLTNENIFELDKIPQSIAVFGAGVIGLELGFAFKNLGSKITIFNRSNKLLKLNDDINEYLIKNIKRK
jgi:dihydrolipoamide dehydrogenase